MASSQEPKVACLCGIVGFDRVKQQESGEKLQEQYPKSAQKKHQTKDIWTIQSVLKIRR